ncbi:MAG: cell division protein FtsZ [Bradyrhizobium sp.]|uniref:cell division protein FtsZ n=1 Tax=Bradyrhizobium sp. TaxID=376 RepID=UPI001C295E53|nr:cell division protein FtsZ [Bradyrhizobium sp.]MBU6462082.1 cell division protein FtsZ [Pseudomonadota bacterium]MDE2066421.1 cell division protein FtsZ [Bradyrhizobium sp.]MDE2243454.1 cell division protein FtsZ [Bradyrhizobium sp.]
MTINLNVPDIRELKPRITVFGVGGAGGNAVNNMITAGLQGVDFVVANTDAQALTMSKAQRIVQMGTQVTQGLGAGSQPDVGAAAAQEVIDELRDHLTGANMVFVTAGMGGGTGTGAAPVIAKTARDMGILTVGVVTKPFHFEGQRRMRTAESGIAELHKVVDTLLIIPNQNLFRVANEKTTFADAFAMADQVLYSGVACITDLMVKEGLINLDFADVRAVMREMGKAMMGTGEASGDKRALTAAEAAIANPLIDDSSMKGARGLLISITGGKDLTLFEVDEAATRIREEVDQDANIIVGATFDEALDGIIRVSVVATGIEQALISRNANAPAATATNAVASTASPDSRLADLTARLRADNARLAERAQKLETTISAQAVPPAQAPAPAPAQPRQNGSVERAAFAAIAAAVSPEAPQQPAASAPLQPASYGDVTVRPIAQKPTLFPDQDAAKGEVREVATPETFIPQAAERAPPRAPRMPNFEDLPMPAQNEIRQARGETDEEHPQKTRMSLLQRLANVGLGRRDEEKEPPIAARASGPAMAPMPPLPERKPQRTIAQQMATHEPVSEYARRPAPQGLDSHGRPAPVAPPPQGDDHLDIPAFLRRQSN